jgi:hypothetical protein
VVTGASEPRQYSAAIRTAQLPSVSLKPSLLQATDRINAGIITGVPALRYWLHSGRRKGMRDRKRSDYCDNNGGHTARLILCT